SWLMETNREGYTVDPEELTGAEADRAAYTVKTGKPAPVAPAPTSTKLGRFIAKQVGAQTPAPVAPAPPLTPDGPEEEWLQNSGYYERADDAAPAVPRTLPAHGAAIAAPLVVLVDARFAVAIVDAITLGDWLAPYIEKVEKMQEKPLYMLDLDYGKGDKFLAGVLTTAAPSTGLIMASSTHPRIGVALSALSNQGAVIIYGR
ncbi:unnamed protein product, partial [marine sediment metagenome]